MIKGSIILTISNISIRFLSYLYRIVMGRYLTEYEFGILNLALPLQFMIILLTSAGIAPSVAKYVSEYKAKGRDVNLFASSAIVYYGICGAILGALLILASPLAEKVFNDANTVIPFMVAAFSVPLGIVIAVYTGIFQGLKRFTYMSGVLFFEQGARLLIAFILVIKGHGALGAILGSTLGFVAALPLSVLLARRVDIRFVKTSYEAFKEVFIFSVPTSIVALSSFLLAYADVLLIGFYMTPEMVGVYSAASPASRLILIFTTAFYAVLIPAVSEIAAKGENHRILKQFKLSLILSTLVVVPMTLLGLLFSEEIISLLFTDRYLKAVPSFEILVVGMAFLSLYMTNSAIYQGIGKPDIPMKILVFFSVMDIMLNMLLIPSFGLEGAAFSTSLSTIGAGIVSTVLLAKHMRSIQ